MRITHLLGMTLLATATLFTSCKKDDPKPSFEERKAEFQKAFVADPQHDAKMREMNTMIFRQSTQTPSELNKEVETNLKEFAATKGFTLTDEEASKCFDYIAYKYFNPNVNVPEQVPVVTFDMLSENVQNFIKSFKEGELDALHVQAQNWFLKRMIDRLYESDPNNELFVKGAEKYVQLAKEYGIEFTIEEAKQLLKETFEAYYNSLKIAV